MSGIFPSYIGPTVEYRHASRFPRWLEVFGDIPIQRLPVFGIGVGYELVSTETGYTLSANLFGTVLWVEASYKVKGARFGGIPIPSKVGYSLGDELGAL